MKAIALCINVPELDRGGWRDPEVCKKYPGSGWATYLHKYADERGIAAYSGSEAIARVLEGVLKPGEIQVIQEEDNPMGTWLINQGADPALLFCFETPLFTPIFYDRLPEIKKRFRRQMLFSGGTDPLYFPSFDLNDLREPEPWDDRKNLCMVVSNKHYSQYAGLFRGSPSWEAALKTQLHDLRYEAINHFRSRGQLDLYGKGWPDAPEIPAGEKVNVMRNYRFALCFENGRQPGYVTEKIFDCLVAGVVPVYEGALDIARYVPEACFIDLRQYPMAAVESYLDMVGLTESPNEMAIDLGQHFLRSPEGRRHSYQGFAERVLEVVGVGA